MLKEKIIESRNKKKLSQIELALKVNTSEEIIKNIEISGEISDGSLLLRISRVLELDPISLFQEANLNFSTFKMQNNIFDSKNKVIKTIFCGSWESFLNFYTNNIFEVSDQEYIWRGHKDSNWKLESTLLREYPEGINEEFIDFVVQKFKKSTLGNNDRIEIEKLNDNTLDNKMLWLSLGQHYGLKTPLLDWTTSPYVASFFAYLDKETSTPYRTIFALNKKNFEAILIELGEDIHILEIENHFNKRLLNQQGLFMYGPLEKDLESLLLELEKENNEPILYKFLIPNSDRKNILKMLNKMNMNPKSLFPDLIGASLHTNIEIELEI